MRAILESERVAQVARAACLVLVVAALVCNAVALRIALNAQREQREGRAIAVQTTCTAISAVIDAGRAALLAGGQPQPAEFERNLRELGFPDLESRRNASRIAAATYSRLIATRVAAITKRSDLVRKDGSLDCNRLREAAKT